MSAAAAVPSPAVPPPPGYSPGLEGVVAFRTEIAEPDRDGGALRYRGVDIDDLVGAVGFGDVFGLLVDGDLGRPLPREEPGLEPLFAGDVRVDAQAGLALLGARWSLPPLLDATPERARDDLARCAAAALALVARSARGAEAAPVPESALTTEDPVERFLTRWHGEADPTHVRALDAYWVSAAEHGLNASTFTARVVASTGADAAAALSAAVGAMSGPLHGGAPARVLPMIAEVERTGDAAGVVHGILDRSERLMGFGHRVYRAEDPRARVLRRTARELGAPRYEAAAALETAALTELRERRPDRAIETNVEFWAAVVLDLAGVPAAMMPAMFTCARTAGWAAHVLEQRRTGRLVRPSAQYIGPGARPVEAVARSA
ncbi:citrate synthase 2 [Actinomycetospora straminea]|uniref:citrate synthase (unknown stereospecificity) n=1 Tax=Actinomycetospora straminea TaxID=663607 RepID=A0ABP9EDV7_9PSEU|nr:citrate synthase 2 [Actinomycetospora straminea]MDD7932112.1 citrate synthase 2 [Actinomycetospora straminea]